MNLKEISVKIFVLEGKLCIKFKGYEKKNELKIDLIEIVITL